MASRFTTTATDWASGRRGDHRFVEAHPLFFVPRLLWIVAAFATLLIPNPRSGLLAVSALSVSWTVVLVQRRGGPFLTPSGVYFLASGVFVGIAAWYLLGLEQTGTPMNHLRSAAMLAFILSVLTELVAAIFCIRWRVDWVMPLPHEITRMDYRPPSQFLLRGIALLAFSRLPQVVLLNYELSNAIGLPGVVIIVLSALSLRRRIRWLGDIVLVVAGLVVPAIWVSMVFKGGGRLTVAGLGVAALMVWNIVRASGWQKLAAIVAIPLFLMAAGINRLENIEREYGVSNEADSTAVVASGAGLESVYDPLDKFGTVLLEPDYPGGLAIGPRYGATFVNTLLMPVPRSMWENKPKGFGAELTELFAPEQLSFNQSYAALFYTEWYANFGWLGLAAAPVAVGWFVARLDRAHARLSASRLSDPRDWWNTVVLMCLVASLGDLFWAGTFTYYTRGGMAALIAWAVGGLSMMRLNSIGRRVVVPAHPYGKRPVPVHAPTGQIGLDDPT